MDTRDGLITVVGLHGYGIDERQLQTLLLGGGFNNDGVALITPRAPLTAPEGGYSWFDVAIDAEGAIDVDHHTVDPAIAHVRSLLESEQGARADGPLVLLGYSQGGGLASACVPHVADLVDGVVSVSGFIPGLARPALHSAEGLPVLLEFGSLDHAIDERARQEVVTWVTATGAQVQSHVEVAPHVISAAHRRNISTFLSGLGAGSTTRATPKRHSPPNP